MKAVKSSTSPYDNTERKIIMEMLTERDLRRSRQRRRIEEIRRKSTFNGFILGLCLGVAIVLVTLYLYTSHKTEKPEELNPQILENEPTGREFAWSSEIPEGISQKLKEIAKKEGMYCNVEYLYMGKRISIGYTGGGTTISIRGSIYLENASIYSYSSGDGVVIYGYEGYMFKRVIINEENIFVQTITINYHIPLSEKPTLAYEIKDGYYLSVEEKRIALYKNWKQVGEAITIEDTPYRIYQNMILTTEGTLYMPYVVIEDGEETLYMQMVASGIEVAYLANDESKVMDGELFVINSIKIGHNEFPVLMKYGVIAEVYVPNEFKTYKQYMAGEIELTPEMDLGWHSVQIY